MSLFCRVPNTPLRTKTEHVMQTAYTASLIVPVDRMDYRSGRQPPGICQNRISPVRLENVYGLKLGMLHSGGGRLAGSAGAAGISETDWSFSGPAAAVKGLGIACCEPLFASAATTRY